MATLLSEKVPPSHPFDSIAVDIETRYEGIVNVVRERKEILLRRLSEFREEYDSLLSSRDRTERELERTKEYIETIKENDLKMMQQEFLAKIEDKMQKLQFSTANYFIHFDCETQDFENKLGSLGELVKVDYKPPKYSEMVTPVVAVGSAGNGKDEFYGPRGVAFDEDNQMTYVCDLKNSCIKILSITGEFMSEFGRNKLDNPWGILLSKDSIFVTDCGQCAIFHFNFKTHRLVKKVGKKGSGKGEFNDPRSLTIGPDGDLYVAEDFNNRVSVLDCCLNMKRYIKSNFILSPKCVQFSYKNMLILSSKSLYRVHVLTLQGEYIKSIISIEPDSRTLFFCLDRMNNILVSVTSKHFVQVYNEEGKLLHTIGKGLFDSPYGLTTSRSGKLVVVSDHMDHGLQIF